MSSSVFSIMAHSENSLKSCLVLIILKSSILWRQRRTGFSVILCFIVCISRYICFDERGLYGVKDYILLTLDFVKQFFWTKFFYLCCSSICLTSIWLLAMTSENEFFIAATTNVICSAWGLLSEPLEWSLSQSNGMVFFEIQWRK